MVMNRLTRLWSETHDDRRAVTALEYGLIAALIAVFIIGALATLGGSISTTFSTVASSINGA